MKLSFRSSCFVKKRLCVIKNVIALIRFSLVMLINYKIFSSVYSNTQLANDFFLYKISRTTRVHDRRTEKKKYINPLFILIVDINIFMFHEKKQFIFEIRKFIVFYAGKKPTDNLLCSESLIKEMYALQNCSQFIIICRAGI